MKKKKSMIKARRVEKLNACEKFTEIKFTKSNSIKSGIVSYLQKLTVSHGKTYLSVGQD